jgi:hypothetical protein
MARYVFLVMADSSAGRDDELDTWYDEVHVGEMLSVPGVESAQRFRLVSEGAGGGGTRRFLTLYEVESDSVARAEADLLERGRNFHMSDSLDHSTSIVGWFEPLGPVVPAP